MTTISTTATSGADGWLHLQVPEVLRGQPLEVVAVLQSAKVTDLDAPVRRQRAYAALEQLAHLGGIAGIADPAAWQRTLRLERLLPGREDGCCSTATSSSMRAAGAPRFARIDGGKYSADTLSSHKAQAARCFVINCE